MCHSELNTSKFRLATSAWSSMIVCCCWLIFSATGACMLQACNDNMRELADQQCWSTHVHISLSWWLLRAITDRVPSSLADSLWHKSAIMDI